MNTEELKEYMRGLFDFKLKQYQADFAIDCLTKKRVVGVFCRQSGKSETVSKISIILVRKDKRGDTIIFAPTDRQAGLIADKIRNSINKMPYMRHFYCTKQTQREFSFSNGRKIICETVGDSGESIRGYTAGDIIFEEAGSIKDSIVQEVIMPMGATTDPTIIKIGTPRGKNHFYESSKSPAYVKHLYDYTYPIKEGLMTEEYIEEMRRVTPDIIFRTEYMAEFIEDQDAFFNYDLIDSCIDKDLIFESGGKIYIGCDIARLGQDSTCLIVTQVKDNIAKVIKIVEIKTSPLTVVIDKIEELISEFQPTRVFIDETGLGAGVSDVLSRKYNIPKLQTGAQISKFPHQYDYGDRIVGVKFTIQSKLDIFSNLKTIMQQSRIRYPNNPKLIAQLRDFRYELTESQNVKLHHSEYGYDDFVDALALSVKEANVKSIGFAF